MNITEITPFIGIEFTDAGYEDLLRQEVWQRVVNGVNERDLVIVRSIDLTPQQQIALAGRLGRPVPFGISSYHHPEFEEIMISSNEVKEGKPIGVARVGNFWHQDSSYFPDPAPYTMLHGVNVPSTSGHTKFASAADVYDRLPGQWQRKLEGRIGVHTVNKRLRIGPSHVGLSVAEFRALADEQYPPSRHEVIRKDRHTGRMYVYGSPEYMDSVEGFDANANAEYFALLEDLIQDEARVYTHVWTPKDLVIWKTQTTYHVATEVEPGVGRTVHRVSIESADAKPSAPDAAMR
jgi:taurine dioxygenase